MTQPASTPLPFVRPLSAVMNVLCLLGAAGVAISLLIIILASSQMATITVPQKQPVSATGESGELRLSFSRGFQVTRHKPVVPPPAPTPVPPVMVTLAPGDKVVSFVAMAIPAGFLIWGLLRAARLFRGLRRSEYFAPGTVSALRDFAVGVLGYKLLQLVTLPVFLAVVLAGKHIALPPWRFDLFLNVMEMDGLLVVVFMGAVAVIAAVMTKAAEIAEENAQIV